MADIRSAGGRVVLLIEDKTGSPLSANQFIDTLGGARDRQKWSEARFAPLYLRTGNAPRDAPAAVAGWSLYGRSDLLAALDEVSEQVCDNAILSDFRAHIERLDRETAAFRVGIDRPWEPAAWHGYFAALEQAVYERVGNEANGIGWGHIRGEHTEGLWWTGSRVYPQITGTQTRLALSFRLHAEGVSGDDRTRQIDLARDVLAEHGFPLDVFGRTARAGARTLSLGRQARDFRSDPLDVAADTARLVAARDAARHAGS